MTEDKENIVDIDKYNLDVEWQRQVRLYNKYAKRLAEARSNHLAKKANLEYVEADLSLKIRKRPKKFDLSNVTEKGVEATIKIHPAFVQAQANLLTAKLEMDRLEATVKTLDQRKKALEDLVQLILSDLFSRPKMKGEKRKNKLPKRGLQKREEESPE